MPTEFDLPCATCGGPLAEQAVPADSLKFTRASETLSIAQCADCGSRYFPESTLERL